MTTVISKNQEETINVKGIGFHLEGGDLLVVAEGHEVASVGQWIEENGVYGVYFDPQDDVELYNDFSYVALSEDISLAIRFHQTDMKTPINLGD
jgi:hypothetical protein